MTELSPLRNTTRVQDARTLALEQLHHVSIEPHYPGFLAGFPAAAEIDAFHERVYPDVHQRYVRSRPRMQQLE
jgi:hypothetical protein